MVVVAPWSEPPPWCSPDVVVVDRAVVVVTAALARVDDAAVVAVVRGRVVGVVVDEGGPQPSRPQARPGRSSG